MANLRHLKILRKGVGYWNYWRRDHPDVLPDLRQANLCGADLGWATLKRPFPRNRATLRDYSDPRYSKDVRQSLFRVNLSAVDLRGADLRRANLECADLRRANLIDASLAQAGLEHANLSGADLSGTTLFSTELVSADLSSVTLSGADAWRTNFADIDLSSVKGLDTIRHRGPSTVGIDTIYKSHGKIPEVFLRGCGVPEEFIDFIRQMEIHPIEFYSCFISYSTKDQEFAERLHADLQAKGVRCWFAPEEMKAGRKLHEQIDEAIRLHDKLLLILSDDSMSSNWVKSEIANAREREKREGKQLLFPITLVPFEAIKQWKLFDADIGIDSAREIREYFIPDFSNWKDHDSYQKAFQRLVKDLKAGAGG
jgi:hypothetical protein